jgi:hypothetical protein
MVQEDAEAQYGENPDYYNTFFVPERARWAHLQEKLNDATEPFGRVLDKALGALTEANESLDHISFMRTQGNKRVVSDEACKDLVRHFSRYSLRNEDSQFSDLLGAAYEFLINMFAESAGKKGGDFYTPREVIRLMVRMLNPAPGMSVYDPTCGSGGMLIISREYIEQSGGDPTNLRLCGQVNDASAWSICRLNMLLHGIRGADIQLQDTLLHPMHREAGELERFDRVIANPPFSQNYSRTNMEFPERFRWGWCDRGGVFLFNGKPQAPAPNDSANAVACGLPLNEYAEFAPAVTDRSAIRPLIEEDPGVQARVQEVRDAVGAWWAAHSRRLAELPVRRDLNAVRNELLDTFTLALLPLGVLDRFKLAGVVATWWTDTLTDFKTLLEIGLAGVIDGWIDAIADAVEDDDNVGPAFNPFAHKLVRHTMADYLQQIDDAKSDIVRLKGEKEAFEESNPSDDADEEELAGWNYPKNLQRQIRELKAEHKDALREFAKLEQAAAKKKATAEDRKAAKQARAAAAPVVDQLAALEAELVPYEQIKADLTAARGRYRQPMRSWTSCGGVARRSAQRRSRRLFWGSLCLTLRLVSTPP